jgi:hypothetical protein
MTTRGAPPRWPHLPRRRKDNHASGAASDRARNLFAAEWLADVPFDGERDIAAAATPHRRAKTAVRHRLARRLRRTRLERRNGRCRQVDFTHAVRLIR